MASKLEHIQLLRQYFDIYAILDSEKEGYDIWQIVPYSEEYQWWMMCWNLSSERIEVAEHLFINMDIVELFEKYSIKISMEYTPKGDLDG